MSRDISPLSLMPLSVRHRQWLGALLGFVLPLFPLRSLILYSFLSCAAATGTLPGIEHDYSISPKFVCTPIPPEADPSCFSPPSVPHGASSNGHSNSHNGSNRRGMMSDEAKATILHLRESLVRQKETILDQRETIRELTAKLTLCEGFGSHHSIGHHDNHHSGHHENHHDTHRDNHHDSHHDDHHGHHSSHHASSSSHHGPSAYPSSDHHYSHGNHRADTHNRKVSSYTKHSSFSPEQTGKTLQTLKERLENLQARNSSSSYSSSLRELLQRKISALEEQLHSYNRDNHDYGHHNDHHGDHHDGNHSSSHFDDHHDDHHTTGHHDPHHDDHHGTGHHDDHHGGHHSNHHESQRHNHHSSHHYDHHYGWPHSQHPGHYSNHHGMHHSDHHPHHADHHRDDHHDYHHSPFHHYNDHHDGHLDITHTGNHHHHDQHGNDHQPRRLPLSSKETSLQGPGHGKLETVLSQLHHGNTDHGIHKKLKSPSAFMLDFPMRTNYMFARMRRSVVTEVFALTVCLWLKAGAGPGLGTPFSYAVPGQANELVLIEWGNNPMELLISDKAVTLPITLTDGKWHHVCVTWTTRDGVWEAYQDGAKKGTGQNLSAWHPIKPGGTFILGQEQDTLGGRFDVTQSFMGELSDLQIWSRVLTPNEIHSQATCGGHLVGDIMSWSEESVELHVVQTTLLFQSQSKLQETKLRDLTNRLETLNKSYHLLFSQYPALNQYCSAGNSSTGERQCSPCPAGWTPQGDKCFLFSQDRADWISSQYHCMTLGGATATVRTEDEQVFLWKKAQSLSQGDSYWLGLRSSTADGGWQWSDGSGLKEGPQFWWREPDATADNRELCGRLTPGDDYRRSWFTSRCSNSLRSICEKRQASLPGISVSKQPTMSDLMEEKIKNYRTAPFDARFPNTNQTRNCFQNYLDVTKLCQPKTRTRLLPVVSEGLQEPVPHELGSEMGRAASVRGEVTRETETRSERLRPSSTTARSPGGRDVRRV
ncbi:hypothetical protein Q5P01_018747 [Channa striata]|uniref:Uncharacterized protein n=1 Tax=Channa striata TaxID=64152 RepID=A0AA88M5S3_CHASR|nr:hypothetical protein Q5P01_018747 [Channa striata]